MRCYNKLGAFVKTHPKSRFAIGIPDGKESVACDTTGVHIKREMLFFSTLEAPVSPIAAYASRLPQVEGPGCSSLLGLREYA